jgi:hypothetical protein
MPFEGLPPIRNGGTVTLKAGDMLAPEHGEFDAVISMDALIHYNAEAAANAIAGLARRTIAQNGVHAGTAHQASGGDASGRQTVSARRPVSDDPACRHRAADRDNAVTRRHGGLAVGSLDPDFNRILHLRGSGACTLMTLVAKANRKMLDKWKSLGPRYLPFADAASEDLPLGRLMRLVDVPMVDWPGGSASDRHAQPGDDRRARRSDLAGGA